MTMKVGILTFHRALNYGAVIQAYALQFFLESKGCDVEIIDYYPLFLRRLYAKNPKRPHSFLFKVFQRRSFKNFLSENLHLSSETFTDKQSLQVYATNFDAIITGSDTIWNSHVVGDELDTYLLDFVKAPTMKISYAASIGGGNIDGVYSDIFKAALQDYRAVSLREESLCGKLSSLSHRQVVDVADPTFLLPQENYSILCANVACKTNGNYIVFFDLANDMLAKECAKAIKAVLDLPIINLGARYERFADHNPLNISPSAWLSYISNASFVCTNSFHATTLSIICKRPFVSVAATIGSRALNNVRVVNVLQKTGLQRQFADSTENIKDKLYVDFDAVQQMVDGYVQRSVEYLSTALRL